MAHTVISTSITDTTGAPAPTPAHAVAGCFGSTGLVSITLSGKVSDLNAKRMTQVGMLCHFLLQFVMSLV